jgi:hypothetical protein
MQLKNIQASMQQANNTVTCFLLKWRFPIAVLFAAAILLLQGCSKGESPTEDLYKKYFEENVLNSDFVVALATENNTDITAAYDGWVFRLLKNTFLDGPMTAKKNGVTYTGTWSSNADYGMLTINITQPSTPAEFVFINRQWKFTKKALPVMELAPWASTSPIVLHMRRL